MNKDFAIMICSHGRADNVQTYNTLKKINYTGKIIIVIDDEDEQADKYKKNFKNVEVFSKQKYYEQSDGFLQDKQKCILYARNACFDIAKKNNIKYFAELDDDIKDISIRKNINNKAKKVKIKDGDTFINLIINILKNDNITALSLLPQKEYIGGISSKGMNETIRLCHQIIFLKTEKKINFMSSMNEDIITELELGKINYLFLGLNNTMFDAEPIGNNKNGSGMDEFYKKLNSYSRSFLCTVARPDCSKVQMIKDKCRIKISWEKAVPKILSEVHKK